MIEIIKYALGASFLTKVLVIFNIGFRHYQLHELVRRLLPDRHSVIYKFSIHMGYDVLNYALTFDDSEPSPIRTCKKGIIYSLIIIAALLVIEFILILILINSGQVV